MENFNDPVYVFDFRTTLNCATTESANPGQEIPVLVRLERDLTGPAVRATGKRSADGQSFTIDVKTTEGLQTHSWTWTTLLEAIRIHRGTPGERPTEA